jgi:hypothetical protein
MIQILISFGFDAYAIILRIGTFADTVLRNKFNLNMKTSFEPVVRYG